MNKVYVFQRASQKLFTSPADFSSATVYTDPKTLTKDYKKDESLEVTHLGSSSLERFGQYFFTKFLNEKKKMKN